MAAPPGLISAALYITSIATSTTESVWFYLVDFLLLNMFILTRVADPIFVIRNKDIRELISEIKWIPLLKVQSDKRPY